MAANKVVFGNKVLIDLTGDTVTEEALLKGYTAHKADGTIITGTAFAGYPNEFVFLDNIEDSSGNPIKDSSGKTIQGQTIYRKARNSVLLDSTGDVIEDGFEQQIEVVKFVWVSFISRLLLHLNPLGTINAGQFVSSIYLNEGKTDEEYAEEISYIIQEIVESDLVFNISVYTSDDNLVFYSLPEQHSQPDVEVILEKMADVKRQQKTQKDYKEWKKQNQNNETNSD